MNGGEDDSQLNTSKSTLRQRRRTATRTTLGLCVHCKIPVTGSTRCQKCRSRIVAYYKIVRRKNQERGLCTTCGSVMPCAKCKARDKKRHAAARDKVFNHYGNQCKCCGESNLMFLSIDHVNNDGAAHRREIGKIGINSWLISNNFPPGFQLLCFNCNMGKQRNGGVCPHNKGNGE